MTETHRTYCCRLVCAGLLLFMLSLGASPCQAQSKTIRWLIHEFVGVGGYWYSDGSAIHALGSPKFGGTTSIFVKPAHRFGAEIDGGIDLFGAGDHWLIGGGHNTFDLYGLAGRIRAPRENNRISPYLTAGLYVGHIKSSIMGFSETKWPIPSANFGAEYKFARYFTIKAGYRVSGKIHGVDTNGFNLSLKFF